MTICSLKKKKNLKIKTKLKTTSVKTLLSGIFYKTNLTDFCVDTLILNEHVQLKCKT